jgi:pentose-5-phosphate-3-epimerase
MISAILAIVFGPMSAPAVRHDAQFPFVCHLSVIFQAAVVENLLGAAQLLIPRRPIRSGWKA